MSVSSLVSVCRSVIRCSNQVKPLGTWLGRVVGSQSSYSQDTVKGNNGTEEQSSDYEKLLVEKDVIIEEKDKEIYELKEKYTRALAETENTRDYMKRQIQDAKLYGIQSFSKDIVNIADILEKAIESVPPPEGKDTTLETMLTGLKMMETDLVKVFDKHGLKRIDPSLGDDFDPNYHEALFQMTGDKPGTVSIVSKVGYTLNGRTIRPALVGVVRDNK